MYKINLNLWAHLQIITLEENFLLKMAKEVFYILLSSHNQMPDSPNDGKWFRGKRFPLSRPESSKKALHLPKIAGGEWDKCLSMSPREVDIVDHCQNCNRLRKKKCNFFSGLIAEKVGLVSAIPRMNFKEN